MKRKVSFQAKLFIPLVLGGLVLSGFAVSQKVLSKPAPSAKATSTDTGNVDHKRTIQILNDMFSQIDPASKDRVTEDDFVDSPTEPPELSYAGTLRSPASSRDSAALTTSSLKCLVYGNTYPAASPKQKFSSEIVRIELLNGKPEVVRYRFSSTVPTYDDYIFDPVLTPDGRNIVFKFGQADSETDSFGLYSFNIESKRVRKVTSHFLFWKEVKISPSGRFVTYVVSGNRGELWVSDLTTGSGARVAQGNSLSTVRWLPNDELAYSLKKAHKVNGKDVLQPDAFAYNATSKVYRRLIERALILQVSTDGNYALYSGVKHSTRPYTPQNSLLLSGDLKSKTSNRLNFADKSSAQLYTSFWDGRSKSFFLITSKLDQSYKGKDEKKTGIEMNKTFHTIYRYSVDDQSLSKFAELTTISPWEGTDLQFFSMGRGKDELIFGVKAVSTTRSPYTIFSQRRYTLKSLDLKTKQWKDIAVLEGVMGLSGLQQDSKQANLITY